MVMLSESTIRTHIQNGVLINDADLQLVRGSSYSCRAAKIILGGVGDATNQPSEFDWTTPNSGQVFRVQPRQIIWVRIRETVALPPNVCAFWWQTNTLSRKGLMLVNMSMVDPGYEGPLACLFVNFGREPVDIDPGMAVARLVFHTLDVSAEPYGRGSQLPDYDRELRMVALSGPSSFLSLQEFSTAFQEEKKKLLDEFDRDAKEKADIIFRDKTDNLPKLMLKSLGIAAAGFFF